MRRGLKTDRQIDNCSTSKVNGKIKSSQSVLAPGLLSGGSYYQTWDEIENKDIFWNGTGFPFYLIVNPLLMRNNKNQIGKIKFTGLSVSQHIPCWSAGLCYG